MRTRGREWQFVDRLTGPVALLIGFVTLSAAPGLLAQDAVVPTTRFRESVTLDTDIAVTKKLKTAEDYLAAQQWDSAIEVLDGTIERQATTLVSAASGRYINAGTFCHLLLSRLPAEGLVLYRRRVDPQSRQWYEQGRQSRDEALLRKIVSRAYVGSYGDDALLTLGDWAYERGELDVARRYWKQLLPTDDGNGTSLRYPDPDIGGGEVMLRLLMSSLAAGDAARARHELLHLNRSFPEASGKLAGKSGRLTELGSSLFESAKTWSRSETTRIAQTFAGTASRNQTSNVAVDVGAERWSVPFSKRARKRFRFAHRQPAFAPQTALSVQPVLHEDLVLFNDADRIYAYNIRTGKPAWPGPDNEDENAAIYQLNDPMFSVTSRAAVGIPRYNMTVHEDRLYARMGSPITSRGERDIVADVESVLVMLDLDPQQGQGKLLAKISAHTLGREGSPWSFEGAPLVADSRVYVALRRGQPETQINVACFDGELGRLIWNRKVCAAVSNIGRVNNLVSQQLLTLAEDTLFISTDLGAIAAFDARSGMPLWVQTYESHPATSPAKLSDHTQQGLLPCLYHEGAVYAAPNDSRQIFAIDAHSGVVKWKRPLNDRIRHLLGVGAGNLIVSGDSLWGLNANTGKRAWGREITDPEHYGYGRGLLVDATIWWPTRETIEIRSQLTGRRLRRQPILLKAHGTTPGPHTGGNLLTTDGFLLVAQADRLVVYGEYSEPYRKPGNEISFKAGFADQFAAKATDKP